MIQLREDCLMVRNETTGLTQPCSTYSVISSFMEQEGSQFDQEEVEHASAAVLHYFKYDLGLPTVSVGEFSQALVQVLSGLGLHLPAKNRSPVVESDLAGLAGRCGKGAELFFFASLREELRRQLASGATLLRFNGLRDCVKHLTGARRWCHRCQALYDEILDFLRTGLSAEGAPAACTLMVS